LASLASMSLILAADDDVEWRSLIGLWLKGEGYEVAQCSNGKGVLPEMERRRPDCLVLDYELGDMTGLDVVKAVRARPEFKKIPIVVMTSLSSAMPGLVAESAPDQFVVKSQNSFELLAVLSRLLAP